jgi:hypothetical protein
MAEEKEYQRLPPLLSRRRKQGLISVTTTRSRLWLGSDHLLCVDSIWYSEDYKRFYFRDIQAIVIRRTDKGRIVNAVFGVLAVPPLIAALTTSGGWLVFWFIVAAFFLLLLLLNTLYGPTCVTHLRTAVQTEELASLGRLPRARKVLARLRPLIAQAQGELNPAEIPARMAELAKLPVGSAAAPMEPSAPIPFFPPPAADAPQ